jgi:hypothetical protein
MHEPSTRAAESDDDIPEHALRAALEQTPRGAFALAGLTTALLMLGWLFVYLFIFLPRGEVG